MESERIRIDRWLWAARFFKSRSLAARAVSGGHVHVNGSRVKPARPVQIGDRLRIQTSGEEFRVTVTGINDRRRPAVEARTLYEESEESRLARERARDERRLLAAARMTGPRKRPGKKDRRLIRSFIRKDD